MYNPGIMSCCCYLVHKKDLINKFKLQFSAIYAMLEVPQGLLLGLMIYHFCPANQTKYIKKNELNVLDQTALKYHY